ncbi:MAG: amino acid adenylation domain-containing protein [Nitrospira sp.]
MQQEIEVQGLRLSRQQKRLWLWQQQGHPWQARAVLMLDGSFDSEAVQESLRQVIARHDSLRTTFYRQAGTKMPFQVVSEAAEFEWRAFDLRELVHDVEKERAAEDALHRDGDLNWERGPLVRATFCRWTETRSRVFLHVPAICADTKSLSNVADGLARLLTGEAESSEDPVQYGHYSEWQYELLEGDEASQGRAWWARRLVTSEHHIVLPFECASSPESADAPGRTSRRELSRFHAERLHQAAAAAQVAVPVLLCACLMALLHRITARRDLVCWWRSEGRPYEELSDGIGLYERWLPLHLGIEGNMKLRDVVALLSREQGQAEDWQQYYPAEQAEDEWQTMREAIGFEYGRGAQPYRTPEGAITLAGTQLCTEPLKVRLSCLEDASGLALTWYADRQRVPVEMMEDLADRYLEVLRHLPPDLDRAIADLDIVGNPERIKLTRGLNQTARPLEPPLLMHSMIEAQAQRSPSDTALVAGTRRLSYDDLNRQANRVAEGLRRRGVAIGDRVGLCLDRSADMIVAMLGVLKAGAAYVPVDPAHAAVRLAPQMAQCSAKFLLVQTASGRPDVTFDGVTLSLSEDFSGEPDHDLDLAFSPEELAYIIYTSGSTGQPKGVAVSHRNLANYTSAIRRRLNLQDQWQFATVSTLSADLGHTVVFPALTSGGCLHVIGYETATDGRAFASYLAQHPIDVLKIVPSHFKALLKTAEGQVVWPNKVLVFGGETLPWDLADHVMQHATCQVINHYGPTETTVGATTMTVTGDAGPRLPRSVPVGRPLGNVEAYILDERFEPVPVGVAGELCVGGLGVARGYWSQPDRTAERFVPDPHASQPGSRLYRTGDRTRRLPDGSIEFLGRVDHQVKIRGFRIELGEIESVLRGHPAVQDAVVTVWEEKQAEPCLAAYLVPRGPAPDARGVQEFLRAHVPDYMVPALVVSLDALPLTPNGKVDRKALPAPQAGNERATYGPPETPTEAQLAGIWMEVLGCPRVGRSDNFFDLGGHSLLATQIMSRLRKMLHADLPLRVIFECPTIAELAGAIERYHQRPATASRLIPIRPSGIRPPLYCFDPSGSHVLTYRPLAAALSPEQPVFGVDASDLWDLGREGLSLTECAEEYADLLIEFQPEGAFHLIGWSKGGVTALAAARTLERRGRTVKFLGIMDTHVQMLVKDDETRESLSPYLLCLPEEHQREILALDARELHRLQQELQELPEHHRLRHAIRWAACRGYVPQDLPMDVAVRSCAITQGTRAVMEAIRCTPIMAPITGWWCDETLQRYGGAPIDWAVYTTGGIDIHTATSDHMHLLGDPEVHDTLDCLLRSLSLAGSVPGYSDRVHEAT